MNFHNVLPLFLVGLLSFALAWPIANGSHFYRPLLDAVERGRAVMIDGLRGWLALGVLLTHAACMHSYFSNGTWDSSKAWIYGKAGPVGVSLFFMITSFLFWGRVLRTDGRLNVAEFFRSRVRRIVPMYLASVLLVLVVVAVASGLRLNESPFTIAKQVRPWLTFGFLPNGDINGVQAHHINAVYWTLALEWMFYLALPLLALYHKRWKFAALVAAVVPFCNSSAVLCFLFGALAAWTVERRIIPFKLNKHWMTPLPLSVLLLAFACDDIFAVKPAALLAIFFLFVVKDNSLFGLLATRSARLLGTVSYSIYLLHCIVVFVTVSVANQYWPIASMPIETYMTLMVGAALLTVLLATLTYHRIEHPFIARSGSAAVSPGLGSRLPVGPS